MIPDVCKVTRIDYLPNDYYENVIAVGDSIVTNSFKELKLVERVIKKVKYNNLYILDPDGIYRCHIEMKDRSGLIISKLLSEPAISGLVLLHSDHQYAYIKNISQNPVYIQQGADLLMTYYVR